MGELPEGLEGTKDVEFAPVALDGADEAVEVGQTGFQLGWLHVEQPLDGQGIEVPFLGE